LFDEKAYNLRQPELNFILKQATVSDAIATGLGAFKFENVNITPYDNTTNLEQLTIPPTQSIETLFPYIQERYGIYDKGLAYYYTNGVFHMWKPFDPEPDYPNTVHIYKIPEGMWDGASGYHSTQNGDIRIICTSASELKDLSEEGTENDGNAVSMIQADTVIDLSREVKKDGSVTLNKQNTINVKTSNDTTATKDLTVTKYSNGPTNNIYLESSRIAANQLTTLSCEWIHSEPFLIQPGHKLVYHFDDKMAYTTMPGQIHHVTHKLSPISTPDTLLFKWVTSIGAVLKPKSKST